MKSESEIWEMIRILNDELGTNPTDFSHIYKINQGQLRFQQLNNFHIALLWAIGVENDTTFIFDKLMEDD
jgi:hypothetical protein